MAHNKDILARESASRRQKIMKRIIHRDPEYLTNDLAFRTALEAEGYFKACSRSKEPVEQLIAFDKAQITGYLETHLEDLFNDYLNICEYIKTKKLPKQQQQQKAVLIVFKRAWDLMTTRVGASSRARVAAQKAVFTTAIKEEQQNAVLDELCLQGLGTLSRGRSHEKTAELNATLPEGQKKAKSRLTFLTIEHTDKVGTEFDIITYLVDIKLLPETMLDYTHLPAFKQFAAVMDHLAPAMQAFDDYCNNASELSALHRRERSQELHAAEVEGRQPVLPKRTYVKPAEKASEPVSAPVVSGLPATEDKDKEMRLTWRDLTDLQQKFVKEGKASFFDGKWESRSGLSGELPDTSWAEYLLTEDTVNTKDEAEAAYDTFCERVADIYSDLMPEQKGFVRALVLNYLQMGQACYHIANSIMEHVTKGRTMTHESFLYGLGEFKHFLPVPLDDRVTKHRDVQVKLIQAMKRAEQERRQEQLKAHIIEYSQQYEAERQKLLEEKTEEIREVKLDDFYKDLDSIEF